MSQIDAIMERVAHALLLAMLTSVFWVPMVYVIKGPK